MRMVAADEKVEVEVGREREREAAMGIEEMG